MNALQLASAVAGTTCLLCFAVYIGLAARGTSLTLYSTVDARLLSWKAKTFLALAAVALLICLFKGAEAMLFWVPGEWGGIDSDGDKQPIRSSLAALFATVGGLTFIYFIDKATHDRFLVRSLAEQSSELKKILTASLDSGSLSTLRKTYLLRIAELEASLQLQSGGGGRTAHLLPDGERIGLHRELVAFVDSLQRKKDWDAVRNDSASFTAAAAMALKDLSLDVESMGQTVKRTFTTFCDEQRHWLPPRVAALKFLVDLITDSLTGGAGRMSDKSIHTLLTNAQHVTRKWIQDGQVLDSDVESQLALIRSTLALTFV